MTPTTTTGALPARRDARQTTSRGNGSQQIPEPSQNRNHDTMVQNQPFQPTDRVRLAEHLVPHFDGETHGIVERVVGTRYQDLQVNIGGRAYWIAATDLTLDPLPELPLRIRGATLTPSYVDAGAEPQPSNIDSWTCPVCGWTANAAGPVDIDEDDPFQLEVDEHRRSHEEADPRDEVRGVVGEVSALDLWNAVGEHKEFLDGLVYAVNADRQSFAAALRAVAAVISGDAE